MKKLSLLFSFFFCFYFIIAQEIHGVSKAQSFNVQKVIVPPILVAFNTSVKFIDDDGNGRLDAYENANISFIVQNIGKGSALGLQVLLEIDGGVKGLDFKKYQPIKAIEPGKEACIKIPIKGTKDLGTGNVSMKIIIKEPNGLDCDPIPFNFNTLKFQEPKIELLDGVFSTENGADVFKKKIPAKLNLIVQNTGQSVADKITVSVTNPDNVLSLDRNLFNVGSLSPGESYKISFGFIATANFNQEKVSFKVTTKEAFGKYGGSKVFTVAIDQKLDESNLVVQSENSKETQINNEKCPTLKNIQIIDPNSIDNKFYINNGQSDYNILDYELINYDINGVVLKIEEEKNTSFNIWIRDGFSENNAFVKEPISDFKGGIYNLENIRDFDKVIIQIQKKCKKGLSSMFEVSLVKQ